MTHRVHPEPPAFRTIWALIMAVAIGVLLLSVFDLPPSVSEPPPASAHITLWVYWELGDSTATVEALPGNAVTGFLERGAAQARENMLVLTSTTLSHIAGAADGSALVARAPVIAVLASDPLELAVPASSSIRSSAQLRLALRAYPGRRLFGLAQDDWVKGNFAALAAYWRLRERRVYTAFDTIQDSVAGLEAGVTAVVLAPRSALVREVRAGKLRVLHWPDRNPPEAWVALAAPVGLPKADVEALRRKAAQIAREPGWRRLLIGDGLTPRDPSPAALAAFLHDGATNAARLAALERGVFGS
jgi:tripartite-type tricarboxylate transporter receptor subunit TctC